MGIAVRAPDGPLEVSRQKGPQDLSSRRSMEGSLENHDGLEAAVVMCKGSGGVGLEWRQSDLRVPFPALVWMETEDGVRGRNNGSLENVSPSVGEKWTPKEEKGWLLPGQTYWPWEGNGAKRNFGGRSNTNLKDGVRERVMLGFLFLEVGGGV